MKAPILAIWLKVLVAGLALIFASPALGAEALVRFAAAATVSSPGVEIQGYLGRPAGAGPFPAVVVLHSCLGLRADRQAMASRLTGWGYVALFVDDFATRGLQQTCAVDFPQGLADAYGALSFVSRLAYVDKRRIAAVGYSQGAASALQLAAAGAGSGFAVPGDVGFAAIAAYYPACAIVAGAALRLPTLVLVGAADSVTPAAACEQLAQRQPAGAMQLIVYPGAGHVFDDPQFAGGVSLMGMWLQYNQHAAALSRIALHEFLAAKLAR